MSSPGAGRIGRLAGRLTPTGIAALVALLVLAPVVALVLGAFSSDVPSAPDSHLTFDNFVAVFSGPNGVRTLHSTLNSLALAAAVTLVATVLGGLIAWLTTRTDLPGRGILRGAFMLPMLYPAMLGVIGWMMLGDATSGYVNDLWRAITGSQGHLIDIYSFAGMVWIMSLFFMPYVMTICTSSFAQASGTLEDAAAVAGAGALARLRTIALPMASPAIAASSLFVFTLALEHFVTPAFIGTRIKFNTLANDIFILNRGYPNSVPQSAVIAVLLVALTTLGLFFYRRLTRQQQKYISVSGKDRQTRLVSLGRWRWVVCAVLTLLLLVTVIAPLAAVALRAFMQARTSSLFTAQFGLDNFRTITYGLREGMINSVAFALSGAVICTLLGLFLAYWIVRRRSRATAFTDYMISLPLGIPGIAFGVGMLWAFVATPIYLTVWILLLAYVLRYAVYGVRTMSTGFTQLDPALEEAAMVSGASRARLSVSITMPLLKGSLASSGLLVFLMVFQELSATIILYGPGTSTMSINIFDQLDSGFFGPASALALVQVAVIAVLVILGTRVFHIKLGSGVSV